jgi:hypothetical protein
MNNPKRLGRNVHLRVDGIAVSGRVVGEDQHIILLKGKDGKVFQISKRSISILRIEDEDGWQPIFVLSCANPSIECIGVAQTQTNAVTEEDFDFMKDCPKYCETCVRGEIGEFDTIPRDILLPLFGNITIGEFPQKEEECLSSSDSQPSEKELTPSSPNESVLPSKSKSTKDEETKSPPNAKKSSVLTSKKLLE